MEPVRLQKFLADSGVCSRRAGEAMITAGEVYVNGEPAHLGQKIVPGVDRVKVQGSQIGTPAVAAAKVTLLMNKPRGVVCGPPDGRYPETVFDLLPRPMARQRFLPVGRLEPDAEGFALLTTDGALADRLTRSTQVVRRFVVSLHQSFPRARLGQLTHGVRVENETLRVDKAFLLHAGPAEASSNLEVHVTHWRGRGLRELFSALGFEVKRIQCTQIGPLKLRGMPLRGSRVLTKDEVESLFRAE